MAQGFRLRHAGLRRCPRPLPVRLGPAATETGLVAVAAPGLSAVLQLPAALPGAPHGAACGRLWAGPDGHAVAWPGPGRVCSLGRPVLHLLGRCPCLGQLCPALTSCPSGGHEHLLHSAGPPGPVSPQEPGPQKALMTGPRWVSPRPAPQGPPDWLSLGGYSSRAFQCSRHGYGWQNLNLITGLTLPLPRAESGFRARILPSPAPGASGCQPASHECSYSSLPALLPK